MLGTPTEAVLAQRPVQSLYDCSSAEHEFLRSDSSGFCARRGLLGRHFPSSEFQDPNLAKDILICVDVILVEDFDQSNELLRSTRIFVLFSSLRPLQSTRRTPVGC